MIKFKTQLVYVFLSIFLILITIVYGYTQFLKKASLSAVLQYQLDLKNPPTSVFAISTFDQQLQAGKTIPKGTRFIGMLNKEQNDFVIYFDAIQRIDGKKEPIIAKSFLNLKEQAATGGVSAKIGRTLHHQTKSNVLGAIFGSTGNVQKLQDSVLPRGLPLNIEVD